MVLAWWLERIIRDSTLSITITISFVYLVFFICESIPKPFSGILALVTVGLYLSATGKTKISTKVEHSLHSVVGWTQYAAETLIFLIAGVIVGVKVFASESSITGADWGKMVGFFFLTIICRGLTVLFIAFFINRGNYKLGWKEFLVMTYGGLKGALGLALALIVSNTHEFSSQGEHKRAGELILFYMAGTATLSLLI